MLKQIIVFVVLLIAVQSIVIFLGTSVNAQISYAHRFLNDDVAGNKVGWNPDGHTKVFGIVDSKFNPITSIVIINTVNPISPGVVCHVDYRGYSSSGPSFEVNCGAGNPSAIAPTDGVALHYLIITMPFSLPPDHDIFNTTENEVISLRGNATQGMQIENQTYK